jgi:hypothetical protein
MGWSGRGDRGDQSPERCRDLRSTGTESDEPHRPSVGNELSNDVRVAHNGRFLQLEVEYHVEYADGERLLQLVAGLLPGRDAVGRPEDLH